jgi:hypothetical protein
MFQGRMNMFKTRALVLRSRLAVVFCVFFLFGLDACKSVQQRVTEQEDKLSAAGDEQQIAAQTYSNESWNWGRWGRGGSLRH